LRGVHPGAAQPRVVIARTATTRNERGTTMGSKSDKIKGRIKEAVGVLADDDRLKREGQRDQAVGEVKEKVEQAAACWSATSYRSRIVSRKGRSARSSHRHARSSANIERSRASRTGQNSRKRQPPPSSVAHFFIRHSQRRCVCGPGGPGTAALGDWHRCMVEMVRRYRWDHMGSATTTVTRSSPSASLIRRSRAFSPLRQAHPHCCRRSPGPIVARFQHF